MARLITGRLDLAARRDRRAAEKDFKYYNVKRFILHPGQWTQFSLHPAVLNWSGIRFTASNAARVPNDERGVYSFVVQPNIAAHPSVKYLMYIGMTDKQDFRARYRQYLREPAQPKRREHVAELLEKWPKHLWFYYAPLTSQDITAIEDELLAAFVPPHNRDFPAAISTVYRRVFG